MALRLISLRSLYRPANTIKISKFLNGKNLSSTKTEFKPVESKKSWFNTVPGEKSLFSPHTLKKHYEILPLLLIVGGGIIVLLSVVFRIALTRDDVRYAAPELPYEDKNLESTKIRKLMVFNQNYDTIDELKSIYKDIYSENENTGNKTDNNNDKTTEKK